jgi:hypothetical protein
MFSLLWSAFIGLIIGAVAKFIVPGKDPEASGLPCCSELVVRSLPVG